MGYQAAPHASLGLLCGLYQFVPQTEGTALLFGSECTHNRRVHMYMKNGLNSKFIWSYANYQVIEQVSSENCNTYLIWCQ